MIDIDFSADFKQVTKLFKDYPRVVEKATIRSLNRTNKQIHTAASRDISKRMGLPVRKVKAKIKMAKARKGLLMAKVHVKGKRLNLVRFKPRQTRKGVSSSAWGKRRVYKGAFFGDSQRTVFVRETSKSHPIKGAYGPSIPETMVQQSITMIMTLTARRQWIKNFNADLKFFMRKK